MKKIWIISTVVVTVVLVAGCNRVRRSPGRAYMPDMYYSRAYETYASTEELSRKGIHYSGLPVPGTVARGDLFPYTLKNDSSGYAQSASIKNPLDSSMINMAEAERLYLVYCGICHGTKLDGNGPLFSSKAFPAKPATLVGDPVYEAMPEGRMFHSVTYGKNTMGSYASQMSSQERWMVIAYIKAEQGKKTTTGTDTTKTSTIK